MTNQQPNDDQPHPAVFYTALFITAFIVTFFGLKMLVPQSALDQLGREGTAKVLLGYVIAVGAAALATAVARWLLRLKRKGQPNAQADLSETT